ncbi:DinB family protein [Pontibacter sp. HJ8]
MESTIDLWIQALQHYELDVLQAKPDESSWSLGQVYIHILEDTDYYIEQIESCLTYSDNQSGQMTEFATRLFSNNEFPDERIAGDPHASQAIPQPVSKTDLIERFSCLKTRLIAVRSKVVNSNSTGKTKHPGLGYFSAQEWLWFSDIHMRHHLRQKKRIEDTLKLQ